MYKIWFLGFNWVVVLQTRPRRLVPVCRNCRNPRATADDCRIFHPPKLSKTHFSDLENVNVFALRLRQGERVVGASDQVDPSAGSFLPPDQVVSSGGS